MIATRRRDDAIGFAAFPAQPHMDETAPDLERPNRRVVLMLDPAFALGFLSEKGPGILRRGGHCRIDNGPSPVEIGTCEHITP
jgi:hypothetical protein